MELFHVLNRGVDKRPLFLDNQDRARFVHDLYEFNDAKPAGSTYHSFRNLDPNNLDFVSPDIQVREKIVDIHGWCLMDNHYHMLISERIDGGLTRFIRKLNIGYSKYFNERYDRSGTLFQGRTKKIPIEHDAHFLHILHYIHLNPLDYQTDTQAWRERKITKARTALSHLNKYRWSSYLDYCGKSNFPSILHIELFSEVFGNYKTHISSYIRDMEFTSIARYTLE